MSQIPPLSNAYLHIVDGSADDVTFQCFQQVFVADGQNHLDVLLETSRNPVQTPPRAASVAVSSPFLRQNVRNLFSHNSATICPAAGCQKRHPQGRTRCDPRRNRFAATIAATVSATVALIDCRHAAFTVPVAISMHYPTHVIHAAHWLCF